MKTLERNKRSLYYALFVGVTDVTDSEGYETGEGTVSYTTPVRMRANVSPATGYAQTEQFGNLDDYDKVIVTDDLSCPIDENSVLFLDKEPEFDTSGQPIFDYTVRRVSKSLNSISIAVRKVKVS